MIRKALSCAAAASVLLATGCGASNSNAQEGAGEIVVMAAASLTESFDVLAADFEDAHPGTKVTPIYDGSASLAAQITNNAPADVFASANETNMDVVVDDGKVDGEPEMFTKNRLVIAVPKGNPDGVESLADLDALNVALCNEQVPCGDATTTALKAANVEITPETYEKNVKAALAKVTLGEVDAALVYRTDTMAETDVTAIEFPEAELAINHYPIAVLKDAPNPQGAQEFADYVHSDDGQATLLEHGFGDE